MLTSSSTPRVVRLFGSGRADGWRARRGLFPLASGLGAVGDGSRSVSSSDTCRSSAANVVQGFTHTVCLFPELFDFDCSARCSLQTWDTGPRPMRNVFPPSVRAGPRVTRRITRSSHGRDYSNQREHRCLGHDLPGSLATAPTRAASPALAGLPHPAGEDGSLAPRTPPRQRPRGPHETLPCLEPCYPPSPREHVFKTQSFFH